MEPNPTKSYLYFFSIYTDVQAECSHPRPILNHTQNQWPCRLTGTQKPLDWIILTNQDKLKYSNITAHTTKML